MEIFRRRGYQVVDFDSEADVYCINTCTVTHVADKKSRQAARRGKRRNPDAIVVVTGCYSQVAPEKVSAIRGVDVVVGTQGRADIVDLVELAMTKRADVYKRQGGQKVDMGCAQLQQVVQACGHPARSPGAPLREPEELAFMGDARCRVHGQIPHMELVDHRIHRVLEGGLYQLLPCLLYTSRCV